MRQFSCCQLYFYSCLGGCGGNIVPPLIGFIEHRDCNASHGPLGTSYMHKMAKKTISGLRVLQTRKVEGKQECFRDISFCLLVEFVAGMLGKKLYTNGF